MLKLLRAAVCAAIVLSHPALAKGPTHATLKPWYEGPQPVFSLTDLNNAVHDIPRQQGKVVLVHFFATECGPCIPQLTALNTLVAQKNDPSLSVLAIDVAENEADVRSFLDKAPVNFPVMIDTDRNVTNAWKVHALPTTYVLDRDSQPRFVALGDVDWTSSDAMQVIDDLLAAKP
jgi:thiol-disulfide isomerase/thioredoxin